MKKTLLPACLAMALMLGTNACNQQGEVTPASQAVKLTDATRESLMHDFSGTLSLALVGEPALRQFLKTESIKQFDGDYDVLYQLVRETKVVGDQTFAQVLSKYAVDPAKMAFINQNFLDLNIKVLGFDIPVEEWDTEKFMPLVVVRPYDGKAKTLTAYAVDDRGKTSTIQVDSQQPPTGLAVVIEESERIHVKSHQSLQSDVETYLAAQNRLVTAVEEPQSPSARITGGRPLAPRGGDPEWWGLDCPRFRPEAVGLRNVITHIYIPKVTFQQASDNWTESLLEIRAELYTVRGSSNAFDKKLSICDVAKDYPSRYGASQGVVGYDRWLIFSNSANQTATQGAYLPDWDITLSGDTWKMDLWEVDPGDATQTIKKSYSSNFEAGIKLIDAVTKLPFGIDLNFKGQAGGEETFTIKDVDEQLGNFYIKRCEKLGENIVYDTGRVQIRVGMAK